MNNEWQQMLLASQTRHKWRNAPTLGSQVVDE